MRRLIVLAVIALALLGARDGWAQGMGAPGLQPRANLADVPQSCTARANLGLDPVYSTMDHGCGWTAYGDGFRAVYVVCFNDGNASFCPSGQTASQISFPATQNATLATTVTANAGSNTLTFANPFCRSEMAGSPIWLPGLGPNGAGLLARIVACVGSQPSDEITIDHAVYASASGTSITIAYGILARNAGAGFQPSDVGLGVFIGAYNGPASGATSTITAVNSATSITLANASTNIINGAAETFIIGHDDSTAVSAACAATIAAGAHYLAVPVAHFTPSLSQNCYGVVMRGTGEILAADGGAGAINNTAAAVQELVIPWAATGPAPPRSAVRPARDLRAFRAASSPVVVSAGDSLERWLPNQLSGLATYPGKFHARLVADNPGLNIAEANCAMGGAMVSNFDAYPNQAGGLCPLSTGTLWLASVASWSPDLVTVGFGNNDGGGLSLAALADSYEKLQGVDGTFTKVPDVIYVTHHPFSRINSTATTPTTESDDYASGYICSFAEVEGKPCIDGNAEGEKLAFGYDPRAMQAVRRFDMPYSTNNLPLPYKPPFQLWGFSVQLGKTGTEGSTFWSNFTGNSGVSDPRGPFIAFEVGSNLDNLVWVFWNSGTNAIEFECDPSAGLPGLGCDNPATGLPPVTPSMLANMTVANSGAGGVAVVTSSIAAFQKCSPGGTVAVPGAGPAETVPGWGSYTAPLITTVTTCNSTSEMTLAAAASTTFAAVSGFVMFGNPIVTTSITDASNCSNEPFMAEVTDDDLRLWWCSLDQIVYAGKVMRPRSRFNGAIFTGGDRPQLTIAADTTGGTTYMQFRPVPTVPQFVDSEVQGPSSNTPPSNQAYGGPCGGDGNNHNCEGYGQRVIGALMDAQNLNVSSVLARGNFTSGHCLEAANGAGDVQDAGAGCAASSSITIVAPQGRLTLQSGAPVETADQHAQGTIYYDSYVGNTVPYYTGSADALDTIAAGEVSLTLSSSEEAASNVFDVWWFHNAGAPVLCTATDNGGSSGLGWAGSSNSGGSNTARGTGGNAQLHRTRGYWTNENALAHCFNGATDYGSIAADEATYLGSYYTTAAGVTDLRQGVISAAGGGNPCECLYNGYNRVRQAGQSNDANGNWTYTTASWGELDGNANNRVSFVDGLQQSVPAATITQPMESSAAGDFPLAGLALDSTSANPAVAVNGTGNGPAVASNTATQRLLPVLGFHYLQAMQYQKTGGTGTYLGASSNGGTTWLQLAQVELEM